MRLVTKTLFLFKSENVTSLYENLTFIGVQLHLTIKLPFNDGNIGVTIVIMERPSSHRFEYFLKAVENGRSTAR